MDSPFSAAAVRLTEEPSWRAPVLRPAYRHIFIVDSRDWFEPLRDRFDPRQDLVLTYDLALRADVEALGGSAAYIDRLLDPEVMQENNYRAYEFFNAWHKDASGADVFTHEGVPFGFAFRLDFWNDYIFYVRARLCLDRVMSLRCERMFVGTELEVVESILRNAKRAFESVRPGSGSTRSSYYFPIHRWMRANIRRRGVRALVFDVFEWVVGRLFALVDRARPRARRRLSMFAQEYHPTFEIVKRLRDEGRVRIVEASPTRTHFFARYVPIPPRSRRHHARAAQLVGEWHTRRSARLTLANGLDITEDAYTVIERCIAPRVVESVRIVEGALRYVRRDPFRLELLVANIGDVATLVDCVCRATGIPSYLVINGLLVTTFVDEAKYASLINAYSTSIATHYFAE